MTEPETDDEVAAMADLYELLKPFEERARKRMFEWANTRLLSEKRTASRKPSIPPPEPATAEGDPSASAEDVHGT